MTLHYLDTSALLKRYVPETGSIWVETLCRNESIATSALVIVEAASALTRRAIEGSITSWRRDEIVELLQEDLEDCIVVAISVDILKNASQLVRQYPQELLPRSLDAIHLTSAGQIARSLSAEGIAVGSLVTADRRLLAAAQWAGFAVENPEDHA